MRWTRAAAVLATVAVTATVASGYVVLPPDHRLEPAPMGLLRERSIESNVILSPNTGLGRDHAREDEDDEDDEVVEVKLNTSGRKGKRKEFPNKILLIRHGEKRKHGKPGLSRAGKKRAQCLRKVLGRKSKHNIGLVIAQSYNPDTHMRERPYRTVEPVARDLGLKVHTSCERDDPDCVVAMVERFASRSDKDVLIAWKHSFLSTLAQALGSDSDVPYPDDRYDIMWVLRERRIVEKVSERCKGLDERWWRHRKSDHDPDLEVPEGGLDAVDDDDQEDADVYGNVDDDDDDDDQDREDWSMTLPTAQQAFSIASESDSYDELDESISPSRHRPVVELE